MKKKGIKIWDWVSNPTDVSILGGSGLTDTDMLQMMAKNDNFDLLIANMNEAVIISLAPKERLTFGLPRQVEGYIKVKEEYSKPLLTVVEEKGPGIGDYDDETWKLICEMRTKLITAGIPFYPTMGRAARAARKVLDYYLRRQ